MPEVRLDDLPPISDDRSAPAPTAAVRLLAGPAVLAVSDVDRARRYYTEVLGFVSEPSGELMRDGFTFTLHQVARPADVRPSSEIAGGPDCDFHAYLASDAEVDALYREFAARGAIIAAAPARVHESWKRFIVQDLDGYKISFGARVRA
ncbi:MAG TPA: VOC family protein [Limnochordia bacterium]